jgi:hypothetical protein
MVTRIDPFWLNRWHSLHNSIVKTKDGNNTDDNIEKLLNALDNFGSKQFFYFYFGFFEELTSILNESGSDTIPKEKFKETIKDIDLSFSDEIVNDIFSVLQFDESRPDEIRTPQRLALDFDFPPDYVLRTVIDQIIYDYEVIQRALLQIMQSTEEEKLTLAKANKWGQEILDKFTAPEPGFVQLLDSPAKMIAYFNRSPRIRMIPYCNVALIGIPPTTILPNNRRDMLSIPHEIGHYIYWNGRLANRSIREIIADKIQGQLPFVKNWIEELFADVFAMASSGHPNAMFHWASTMIKDNPPSKLWQDNGVHPIDAVRQRIYFRRIYDDQPDSSALKNEDSADSGGPKKNSKKGETSFRTEDRNGNQLYFLVDELMEILEPISSEINDLVLSPGGDPIPKRVNVDMSQIVENMKDSPSKLRSKGVLTSIEGTMAKYSFESILLSFDSRAGIESVLNAMAKGNIPLEKDGWYDDFEEMLESMEVDESAPPVSDSSETSRTFMIVRDTHFGLQPLESSIWKVVFSADGWTVKGPETGPPGDWEADSMRNAFHL